MKEDEEKKMISMNLEGSIIQYLDDQAKIFDLNRTQFLKQLIIKYRKDRESDELEIIKEMASLNLRKKDFFTDDLNSKTLRILFKVFKENSRHSNNNDLLASGMHQIRVFLAGVDFDLSKIENQRLFDKIKKFGALFSRLCVIRFNESFLRMYHSKEKIISTYLSYISEVIVSETKEKML